MYKPLFFFVKHLQGLNFSLGPKGGIGLNGVSYRVLYFLCIVVNSAFRYVLSSS